MFTRKTLRKLYVNYMVIKSLSQVRGARILILNSLKIARMRAGLRQVDLAGALGVSESLVTKWETKRSRPKKEMLKKICTILDVEFTDLAPDFELKEAL